MLLKIAEHIPTTNYAHAIVNQLLDALPSGSYLASASTVAIIRFGRRAGQCGNTPS
jgi:hypothetical protein